MPGNLLLLMSIVQIYSKILVQKKNGLNSNYFTAKAAGS